MKNFLVIIILLFSFSILSFSQNFKGNVHETSGDPISGATVYIKEAKQGLVCNLNGEFQTTLPNGNYSCTFSCLGYIAQEKTFTINNQNDLINMEIALKENTFELSEVVVKAGEDPAYAIMRNAIKKAPYYFERVKSFECESYIKGAGKSLHIPGWIEKMGGAQVKLLKNNLFLQESYSNIKYTHPDSYIQNVKAFSSTMPNDSLPKDAMGIFRGSIYAQYDGGLLHPKSFSYYRFRYEGFDEIDGVNVSKIKIIPKFKDPKLYEGYLYIADDYWDVRGAELIRDGEFGKIHYFMNYNDVGNNVYMITSFKSHVDMNYMGVKVVFDYLSSVKYTSIQLNDSLIAANKEAIPVKKKKEKKSLEIKSNNDRYKREADPLATKRDSTYWSDIRSVTLNEEEIKSYIKKDTIQFKVDSIRDKKSGHSGYNFGNFLMGGQTGRDSSKVSLRYGGILTAVPEYNFVDGLWLGTALELKLRHKENIYWEIKPQAHWALARERLLWTVDTELNYAPLRLGKLTISGGSTSEDYIADKGMLRIENAIYSSWSGINNAKFYQKDFFKLENNIDITNGMALNAGFEIANRKQLENHTTYSFFGSESDATPNRPPYPADLNAQFTKLGKYEIGLAYTPELYYMIEKGKKRYIRSRFPTLQFLFQQGLSGGESDASEFSRIDLVAHQNIRMGLFNRFHYIINAGKFFNNNEFNYIDYKHFNSASQFITGKPFENSFALLPYYTYSTNQDWVQVFANFQSDYLLLKRLPFMQGKSLKESLHGKYLHTPDKKYYSEWGYSCFYGFLGNQLGIGVGVFVALDKTEFNSWGINISIPLIGNIGELK